MAKDSKNTTPKKRKIQGQWFEEKIVQTIDLVPTTAPKVSDKQKQNGDRLSKDNAKIKKLYNADSNFQILFGNRVPKKTYQEIQKEYFAKKK